MPSPTKPSKIGKNKPSEFKETIATTMPSVPQVRGLTNNQLRYGTLIVWAVATIIAGVAAGLALARPATAPTVSSISPTPVATASLAVAFVPPSIIQVQQSAPSLPNLTVTPATSVSQAGTGSPLATVLAAQVQPSAGLTSLQPGYALRNNVQVSIGTAPVQ